ncbi:MAG: hypothetical protein V1923_04150 [Candidatus Omnitrophota bacterium]
MQAKYKNLLVLLVCVTLTLFFAELGLRIAGKLYLKKLYTRSHRSGPSAVDSTTIVCLGESSTAGLWVKRKESYPFQLEMMLKEYYPQKKIEVLVPLHVGQNTSQMTNRIEKYIQLYDPALVIIMAGYNNESSWGESHVIKFLKTESPAILKIKALIWLDRFRLFKVLRYAYHSFFADRKASHYDFKMSNFRKVNYIWGGSELTVLSEEEKQQRIDIAMAYREAFIRSWRYDIKTIVSAVKKHGVQVLLMTYHINPDFLSVEEFISMANKENIPLVRNDLTFDSLKENAPLGDYLMHDQWHLNGKGYHFIAKNAFEAIRDNRLLER